MQATVRYLVPSAEKPIYIASEGGADAQLNIVAKFDDKLVDIFDARQLVVPPTLDAEGFELHPHRSRIKDFYSLAQCQTQYEQELRELLLHICEAQDLLVFDHTLRSDSPAIRDQHDIRETAAVIHNDYTEASAKKRLRDLLPEHEAEMRLQSRFTIVNVWRSIAGTVEKTPLACCDARTISETDIVPSERHAKERIGEIELVSFNPLHRWYFYPAMHGEEVLLIKTYDSERNGISRRAVHTAFDNPLAPANAEPRESLESRIMVFY